MMQTVRPSPNMLRMSIDTQKYIEFFLGKKVTVMGLGFLGNPRFSDRLASCLPSQEIALFSYRDCPLSGFLEKISESLAKLHVFTSHPTPSFKLSH